jgi:hypothetical protein
MNTVTSYPDVVSGVLASGSMSVDVDGVTYAVSGTFNISNFTKLSGNRGRFDFVNPIPWVKGFAGWAAAVEEASSNGIDPRYLSSYTYPILEMVDGTPHITGAHVCAFLTIKNSDGSYYNSAGGGFSILNLGL